MEPVYLLIEDFMSHRYSEIDFTKFQSALIMGRQKANPRESNGVGKSVIFHATEYVFFGTYPTKTIDQIVREGTDFAQVTFVFTNDDDEKYKVVRKRKLNKSSDVQLFKFIEDKWASISKRTPSDTQSSLLKLIKISAKSFKNSIQFSQNSLEGLVSTKDKEATAEDRRAIFEEAINLSDYKKLEKMAGKKVNDLVKRINIKKAVVESIGEPQKEIDNFKKEIVEIKKEIINDELRRNELTVSISSENKELIDLQQLISTEASTVHEKLSDIKTSRDEVLGKIKVARETIIGNENKIASLNEKLTTKNKELTELEARSTEVRSKKQRSIIKVKKDLESTSENEINGKSFIGSLERKAQELKKPLPDGHDCYACRQPLTAEYKTACEKQLKDELEDILNEIADKKPKLKKVTNKKIKLQKEIDEINNIIAYISSTDDKIKNKNKELSNDNDYINKLKELNLHQKSELEILGKKLDGLNKREVNLEESLKDISNDEIEKKISKTKSKKIELEHLKSNTVEKLNKENSKLGALNARIEDREVNLEKLNKENEKLNELNYSHKLQKKIRQGCKAIPVMIIHTVLDDLQKESNNFLNDLKPSLEIKFTPELNLIYKHYGKIRDFTQLSQGQKFSIALALKLGLSSIDQKRAGVNIKLLQLDEADKPLDEAGVEAYANAIKKLQAKMKILVITHSKYLKDKFKNVITVEGDESNGATTILETF